MEAKPWPGDTQTTVANMDNGNNLLDGGDGPLQDSANNNGETCNRNLRLQQDVQAAVSDKGWSKIQGILDQVNTLVPVEKLLLYLKLPTESNSNVDPLRQSLNPLGSRSEINQTIMWIQTHLEEDKELSLQKKGVYDDYVNFCERNSIKPLSTADFGKVMKQVYPKVRPRRLGIRGQSKYCYSGLRNRVKLMAPMLPDLADRPLSTEQCIQSDLMVAAWLIVKEWTENKFPVQFKTLTSLAYYLVKEFSVGLGSEAASIVTASAEIKDNSLPSYGFISRHKETTLQLQRKLQQKSEVKETKRKQQSPRMDQKSRGKKLKASSCSSSPVADNCKSSPQSQEHSPVCDSTNNLQALPDFNCFQRPPTSTSNDSTAFAESKRFSPGKVAIPRITPAKPSPSTAAALTSPKRAKNNKYKAIQPKPESCDRALYNAKQMLARNNHPRSQQELHGKRRRKKDSPTLITQEESNALFSRERLISIGQVSKDALDEYLGNSNSQEQEEEIMQYFGNNNEMGNQRSTKELSQLRQLLEKNGIAAEGNNAPSVRTNLKAAHKSIIPPNLQNLNVKRRVSFDTHVHEDPVPASPNTRRQNINFIPISPLSPNGVQSKCSSTNASPFVSPRNTPVPRCRGNTRPKKPKKPDLEITIPENIDDYKPITNLPMSAPPSPKIAYIYNKNYQNVQGVNFTDTLSPEVSQLFTNNIPSNENSAFRSQSVPNQFFNHLTFNHEQPIPSDFNDIDFNNDAINVNKIIDDIDQTNLDLLNNAYHLDPRGLVRSQSIEIESSYPALKLPSRSVPSTPIPYNANLDIEPPFMKNMINHNSKSYPSTPLASESFTYNPGQDYLLNGQPIKEKEDEYNKPELYSVYNNESDLIDNKNGFNFETPITDAGFVPKSGLGEGVEDFFKAVTE